MFHLSFFLNFSYRQTLTLLKEGSFRGNLTKNGFPWFTKVGLDEEMGKQLMRGHDISEI